MIRYVWNVLKSYSVQSTEYITGTSIPALFSTKTTEENEQGEEQERENKPKTNREN